MSGIEKVVGDERDGREASVHLQNDEPCKMQMAEDEKELMRAKRR